MFISICLYVDHWWIITYIKNVYIKKVTLKTFLTIFKHFKDATLKTHLQMFKFRETCLWISRYKSNSFQNITNYKFQLRKNQARNTSLKKVDNLPSRYSDSSMVATYISANIVSLSRLISSFYSLCVIFSTELTRALFIYYSRTRENRRQLFFCLLFVVCLLAALLVARLRYLF